MRKLPSLKALRAFEAAARHMSFKAAADELALTPTAISHQIRLIETELGRPLFRRRPRPLTLTPAGAALFPVVRSGFVRSPKQSRWRAAGCAAAARSRRRSGRNALRSSYFRTGG